MVSPAVDRTAILILRVWTEGHPRTGFRARITQTLDSSASERKVATAATPDDIYAAIRTWVEAFMGAA